MGLHNVGDRIGSTGATKCKRGIENMGDSRARVDSGIDGLFVNLGIVQSGVLRH